MPETKVKKSEDFNEWYNEIVELADLCDKRYPIKGMNIWRPYGWKVMNHIDQLIRNEMDRTFHQEVYFPLLIPVNSKRKNNITDPIHTHIGRKTNSREACFTCLRI